MLIEGEISHYMGLISAPGVQQIKQVLTVAELPLSVTGIKIEEILKKIKSDKKNEKGKLNFTLLHGLGDALYDQNVPETVVESILKKSLNIYK